MNRRKFLTLASSSALVAKQAIAANDAVLPAPPAPDVPHRRSKRPINVVLMICDDIGFGDLGSYGSHLPTPNLDAMARDGMRFTRFNGGHPLCSASRASLLTGRYGTRMHTAGAFGPHSKIGTDTEETLLSNLFKTKGYRTAAIGKWHLGDQPEYLPTNRGFDSYFGLNWSIDMTPTPLMRDTQVIEEHTDCSLLTPRYRDEAVKFIEQKSEQPFFLYLGFAYPHNPPTGSPRFRGKSGFGNQGDAIAEIDWCVGEIMAALERQGMTNDTLLLFTGDHGPWGQGCAGLLRGRKASTWEGGFRVPMIAKLPGLVPAGKVCDVPTSNMDVLPTLASVCHLDLPSKPLDGTDASALYLGTNKGMEQRAQVYFSPMSPSGLSPHCIRKGDWKLRVAQATGGEVYTNDPAFGSHDSLWLAEPELYNVRLDPAESYDVSTMHPEKITELQSELDAILATFPQNVQEAYATLKGRVGVPGKRVGFEPHLPKPAKA